MVADVELSADGIVVIRFREGVRLDAHNLPPVVEAHVVAADGQRRPVLVDIRGLVSVDRAARQLAGGPRVGAITSRLALLVGNAATRVIGNFFLRVTGPGYPLRLFADEELARAWLLEVSSDGR
ncbi:MAG: hypothetical protein H6710_05425 [Myxococcales bacterium]|nr:hypothetical protein [Myxococcales bacterium]